MLVEGGVVYYGIGGGVWKCFHCNSNNEYDAKCWCCKKDRGTAPKNHWSKTKKEK